MRRTWPLIVALLAFAAFGILWIVSDRRASQRVYDKYSTANTSPSGLSLAYGYLSKERKVGTLTVSTSTYRTRDRRISAEFVEGVLIRFTIKSP